MFDNNYYNDEYYTPAYASINIVHYSVKNLPDGYSLAEDLLYKDSERKFYAIKGPDGYYGCFTSNDEISFETYTEGKEPWCLGFKRNSVDELKKLLIEFDDGEEIIVRNISHKKHYPIDSPSRIRVKKNLPTAQRFSGVVFKNIDTGEELKITTSYKEVFEKLNFKIHVLQCLLYEAKIVQGWYIDRIEEGYGPIGDLKKKTVNGYFYKNNATVSILLPMQSICSTTGLTRSQIKNLYTAQFSEIDGWRFQRQ